MESPLVTSLDEERGVIPSPLASPEKSRALQFNTHSSHIINVTFDDFF